MAVTAMRRMPSAAAIASMPSGRATLSRVARPPPPRVAEPHLAAEEALGAEPAEQEVGVSDGRLRAAERIAGGPGRGARALRTDAERIVRDAGDRAAAGADLENVHHGDLDGERLVVAADQRRAGRERL